MHLKTQKGRMLSKASHYCGVYSRLKMTHLSSSLVKFRNWTIRGKILSLYCCSCISQFLFPSPQAGTDHMLTKSNQIIHLSKRFYSIGPIPYVRPVFHTVQCYQIQQNAAHMYRLWKMGSCYQQNLLEMLPRKKNSGKKRSALAESTEDLIK